MIRIGFIGAGEFANAVHYPSLSEHKLAELRAVCDIHGARLEQTAEKFNIPERYTDYRNMLDEASLDAIYIVMPPKHLTPIALECLRRGKHLFVEKPPGYRLADTRRLRQAARDHGCKTMFGVNRRFCPIVQRARDIILSHGPITQVLGEFHKYHLGQTPIYGGRSWLPVDIIHTVDTIGFLGGGFGRVSAMAGRVFGSEAKNNYAALFSLCNGGFGVLCANYASGIRYERFAIHGRGVSAYLRPPARAEIHVQGQEAEILDGVHLAGSGAMHRTYGYFQESGHFLQCILHDTRPAVDFAYGLALMELLDKIDQAGGT